MKKLIGGLGYLFVPALLLGYYFTHHLGFLFIYGLLSSLVTLMFIILFSVIGVMKSDKKEFQKMVSKFPTDSGYIWRGALWSLLIFSFLVYENCFFLATLTFINTVLSQLWGYGMRSVKKELE